MVYNFIKSVIAGYAQIAFNSSLVSGIVMIIATWIASPVQAISGVLAVCAATVTAEISGAPEEQIEEGLYGFNAALVGIALPVVAFSGGEMSWLLLSCAVVGGCASAFLTAILKMLFAKWNLPALSLAYCIVISVFSALHSFLNEEVGNVVTEQSLLKIESLQNGNFVSEWVAEIQTWQQGDFFTASFAGLGQVLWVAAPISGMLLLLAICWASRKDAVAAIIGTIVGTCVAILIGLPKDTVMIGLYGYNAALCMIVMTQEFGYIRRNYILSVAVAGFTTILAAGMEIVLGMIGITTFTAFPYVVICILIFMVRNKFSDKRNVREEQAI